MGSKTKFLPWSWAHFPEQRLMIDPTFTVVLTCMTNISTVYMDPFCCAQFNILQFTIAVDNPDLKAGVMSLSKLLSLPQHADHFVLLQVIYSTFTVKKW